MGGEQGPDRIVELKGVKVHFKVRRPAVSDESGNVVRAVDDVDLHVDRGTTFGLVGESGSGKSTLGRVIMGMIRPTQGSVVVCGADLADLTGDALRTHRRSVQIVFQDPFSSLDPRMSVSSIIAEPLHVASGRMKTSIVRARVIDLLAQVGLPPDAAKKYPHQFSGGQRQRIAIARALAPEPRLLVLDEPTSALDVSVRAQILSLLKDLQSSMGLSYIVISHDLTTVAQLASRVGVMYLGRVVEVGPTVDVFTQPSHPYTQALISSLPDDEEPQTRRLVDGYEIPSAMRIPTGCRFNSGCMLRTELADSRPCIELDPVLVPVGAEHFSACHFIDKAREIVW